MARVPLFPPTQAQIAVWAGNLASAVSADPEAAGLSEAQSDRLGAAALAFRDAYAIATTPATRTHSAIVTKDVELAKFKRAARDTVLIMRAFPDITDAKLASLGIPILTGKQRIPPPSVMAKLMILSTGPTGVRVKIHDGSGRRRPEGSTGTVLMTHIGPTPPSDPREWKLHATTSKRTVDLEFPLTLEPGAVVWIVGCFVNNRLERGPLTYPPLSTRLAGRINVMSVSETTERPALAA